MDIETLIVHLTALMELHGKKTRVLINDNEPPADPEFVPVDHGCPEYINIGVN